MGRHSAAPTPPNDSRTQPEGSIGPITDPLLLDALANEMARARSRLGPSPISAPIPVQLAEDDDVIEDDVRPPSGPMPAPFGSRMPLAFGDVQEAAPRVSASPFARPATAAIASADVWPTPIPERSVSTASGRHADHQPTWTEPATSTAPSAAPAWSTAPDVTSTRAESADPVPSQPTQVISPARSLTLSDPADAVERSARRDGNPLTFWIVVGASMIAVLTLVALLPF